VELKVTQEYYMKVVPEWYDKSLLSGEGTLEEQVIAFEKSRIEKDEIYLVNCKRGNATITVVSKEEAPKTQSVTLTIQADDGAFDASDLPPFNE
jgi:hypothetical protein